MTKYLYRPNYAHIAFGVAPPQSRWRFTPHRYAVSRYDAARLWSAGLVTSLHRARRQALSSENYYGLALPLGSAKA